MKLLFDEMMPDELAPLLVEHEVRHVIDLGWLVTIRDIVAA